MMLNKQPIGRAFINARRAAHASIIRLPSMLSKTNKYAYITHIIIQIVYRIMTCNNSYSFSCCYCTHSNTYGKNGATLIFLSFHNTASSTTGSWSPGNILMCLKKLYNILSTTVSFLDLKDAILCLRRLLFCVYISIILLKVHFACV